MASSIHPDCAVAGEGGLAIREWPAGRFRLRGLVCLAACLAVLGAAAALTPCPKGYGTHEQWGMPACSFVMTRGLPCPTCGVTTSLAAAMHGDMPLAARAQVFGVFLVAFLLAAATAGAAELLYGRDVLGQLRLKRWLLAAAIALPAGWGLKLAVGFLTGELPLR